MQSKIQTPKRKTSFWTPNRIIFSTIFVTLFMSCGCCTLSFVVSLLAKPLTVSPTSIPWINNEFECKHTKRVWLEGECWDNEHGITF